MNFDDLKIVKSVAEGTAKGLTASFHEVMTNFLGPVSSEVGAEIGDTFQEWRLKRAIRLGRRSITIIESKGTARRAVPLKLLAGVLDGAVFEDDASMQERWAHLLATSADATVPQVSPLYVDILKRMTPEDAQVIEWVYDRPSDVDPNDPAIASNASTAPQYPRRRAEKRAVVEAFGLTEGAFEVLCGRLDGLGVADAGRFVVPTRLGTSGTGPRNYDSISLTPVGEEFIRACRGDASS